MSRSFTVEPTLYGITWPTDVRREDDHVEVDSTHLDRLRWDDPAGSPWLETFGEQPFDCDWSTIRAIATVIAGLRCEPVHGEPVPHSAARVLWSLFSDAVQDAARDAAFETAEEVAA